MNNLSNTNNSINIDNQLVKTHLVDKKYIDSFVKNGQSPEISYLLLLDAYKSQYFPVYRHAFDKLFPTSFSFT